MQNSPTIDPAVLRAYNTIRALRHKLRLKIIEFIAGNQNKQTVSEIHTRLCLEQSVASQHLAILRKAGIVTTSRDGKFILYSVDHTRIEKIKTLCTHIG